MLVHGYRPEGIDGLVSPEERQRAKPALVEVAFRAYGWTGPWRYRRGFDTITEFSTGIASGNQAWALEKPETRLPLVEVGKLVDASCPRECPVEVLDVATGYQIAAAVVRGLTRRLKTGAGSVTHMSLARTAATLTSKGSIPDVTPVIKLLDGKNLDGPLEDRVYSSPRGPVRRLRFPVTIQRNPLFWEHPAEEPGSLQPRLGDAFVAAPQVAARSSADDAVDGGCVATRWSSLLRMPSRPGARRLRQLRRLSYASAFGRRRAGNEPRRNVGRDDAHEG